MHSHDFAEVFWIERGRGLHLINGAEIPLAAGDLVLIRPSDRHGFAAVDGVGFTLINLAFAADTLAFFKRRYFSGASWPWAGTRLPTAVHLPAEALGRVNRGAAALDMAEQSPLRRDHFLLDLLAEIAGRRHATSAPPPPPWLDQALAAFREPRHLQQGLPALVHLAGCCPAHLNRVVRKHLRTTATELVNDLRLDHAARLLRTSAQPILDLSLDCGFTHLGYFYRRFRARFGSTPRRYRLREQSIV